MVLALSAGLIACGDKSAKTLAPAPAQSDPDSALSDKMSSYIDCFNGLNESVLRSIRRYEGWVKDMDRGPTGKETYAYGPSKLNAVRIGECQKKFERANSTLPALPKLDAAANDYIKTLVEMEPLVAEANLYYERQNYKDDAFAKAKKMHPPLAAAMEKFSLSSAVFSQELETENDKVQEAQLVEVEKAEGRSLNYLRMLMMSKAKQLVRVIEADTFDVNEATTRLGDYEKIADEAAAFAQANSDEKTGVIERTRWDRMEMAAEDFRKAAKERVRRIRDKVPYNTGERMRLDPDNGGTVEGSPQKVIKVYNELITASNAMRR
jgi:hypothetical protein